MNENLKKELKLLLQEHAMFNNTLAEMVEKNSSVYAIKQIEDEISLLDKKIKSVQEEIKINSPKECENKEEAKKSFYNEIKKPTLARSIKMKTAKEELKKAVDDANGLLNKCKTNLYDSIKKSDFAPYDTPYNTIESKKQHQSIQPYNDVMFANRFLVRFDNGIECPEWYVRRVNFYPFGKELNISICDFLTERNGKKRPIITEFNNLSVPFRISIDHLDPTGVVLYTERYHGCKVIEHMKGDLDYANDDVATIELRIMYSDVTYEATN
jgi:hypothetical protein